MRTGSIFLIACLFLSSLSCNGKQTPSQHPEAVVETAVPEFPQTVSFDTGIETEQEILLSQIADKVEYIPLETNTECLLQHLRGNVQFAGGNFIIPCSKAVYMFDGTGKYIRRIGRSGGGPGEYNRVHSIDIDWKDSLIYLYTIGKQIVYSFRGDFIRSTTVPDVNKIAYLNNNIFAAYIYNSTGQEKNRILLLNPKGETVKTFPYYDRFTIKKGVSMNMMGENDRYLFHYKDNLCFKDYYNDTLFTVTEKELQPRYIIRLGKFAIPVEKRWENMNFDMQRFKREASSYLRVNVIETDHYLFMPYGHWAGDEKGGLMLYDKNKKTCFNVPGGLIKNDIDGGIPLDPYTSVDDNTLLTLWTPADIMELAEKNPDILKNEKLKNMKEDDNHVLMIVHLK